MVGHSLITCIGLDTQIASLERQSLFQGRKFLSEDVVLTPLRLMKWAKEGANLKSCDIANNALLQKNATDGNDTRARDQLEEDVDYLNKLQAMSELQRAILTQLIPLAPCAMHSAVLSEALAPFFKSLDKKDRRREFEAAIGPLVQDGLVRYFCCIIDSYAMNPRHMIIARYLVGQTPND